MTDATAKFRLMGLEPSPYTLKVEAFLKFKHIPYEWISRSLANHKLYTTHATVSLIPLLFFPSGEVMQDSTPILERLDGEYPQPGIHPEDPALWFLSCLFEEFGDEWCNKLMFFQRWFYPEDAGATGRRLAIEMLQGKWWGRVAVPIAARLLVRRMVPRLVFAGANDTNIPQLKASFEDLSDLLDTHFRDRPYLLGGRPCFGDFGLWCNFYQAWTDPTAGAYLKKNTPALLRYLQRMRAPAVDGPFEPFDVLHATLRPILEREVAGRFLPWMQANHQAWSAGAAQTRLTMHGQRYEQKTFKYQARTLEELRRKFAAVDGNAALTDLMSETGCLPFLRAGQPAEGTMAGGHVTDR